MDIDVVAIKELRAATKAGMLDCRQALAEARGDLALAEALLKERGLAAVRERVDRAMTEGLVFLRQAPAKAAMVELDCETDFVSRGELFGEAGRKIADIAFDKRLQAPDEETAAIVAELASVLKENISVKRVACLEAGKGERVEAYLHGDGRVGAMLVARADRDEAFVDEGVKAFFHDAALHVAAFGPLFLDAAVVPEEYLREKREAFAKEVAEDERLRGKAREFLDGILAGKLKKHLREVCLLDRGFVKEEKRPFRAAMDAVGSETGFRLSIGSFAYFKVGDSGGEGSVEA